MKLYGSGFNAWNQLRFSTEPGFGQPDDISQFEVILEGGHIEPPISTIAHTSGCTRRGYHMASLLDLRTHVKRLTRGCASSSV